MKLSAIVGALLCAEAAFASALGREKRHKSREARRAAKQLGLKSGPMIPAEGEVRAMKGNNTFVSYSSNWAGSVITSTGVTVVTGTVKVPAISASGDGAIWVGIDGDSCQTAILQTGFEWINGAYSAWYEWYPAASADFAITIAEGDSIKMTVKATSTKAGSAVIENVTTGKTVTKTFSGESDELCEYDAEWIVEDFEECSGSSCSLVPFADFGTLKFTAATATIGGTVTNAGTGSLIDIKQSGTVLTDCTTSAKTVTCAYV